MIMIKLTLILVWLFTPQQSSDSLEAVPPKTIQDTIVITQPAINSEVEKHYLEILEKTNNQLSLWWNPYGVMITSLGVLFAVFAIISTFILFRQSREYKTLIQESLDKHEKALDNLIAEKNNHLKNYEDSIETTIEQYKNKIKSASNQESELIKKFINELERKKDLIDTEIHTYRHSGWQQKDISENFPLNENTNFFCRGTLHRKGQSFVIYIRVITSDGQKKWLAFSGNSGKESTHKSLNEFKIRSEYPTKEFEINQNIYSAFRAGFPELNHVNLHRIDCIRLRGSREDPGEIIFSYKLR